MILSNQNLLKYLVYNNDPLKQDDISDTVSLLNSHIFFKPKVPNVSEGVRNYLIIHLNNYKLTNNSDYFRVGRVVFDIVIHESLVDLENGDLRSICILDELDSVFNKTGEISVGETKFNSCQEIIVGKEFYGYQYAVEFMNFN